ncbi:MAG: Methyltransferase domain [Frankiales bacterium]|nr:Methyltransferase domain [Frankiales bacterium]
MNAFTDDPRHADDLHAWQILRPLLDDGRYLPWTTGSMRPAALVAVCNEIVHGRRTSIVECGSGVSTVVIARLLRQRGSESAVVALEHDPDWARLVSELLADEHLSAFGRVIHAPLAGEPPWYSLTALAELPEVVDLLIIDGPPADRPGNGLRRAPALAALESRLSEAAVVYLDDINRAGEQAVVASWQAMTDWIFDIDAVSGTARGHRRPADCPN